MKYLICIIALLFVVGPVLAQGPVDGLSYSPKTGGHGLYNLEGVPVGSLEIGDNWKICAPDPNNGWSTPVVVQDTVPGNGDAPGVEDYYTSTRGGSYYEGIWDFNDGMLREWNVAAGGSENLAVICDVELWIKMGANASEVYFHQGLGTAKDMDATITYTVESNHHWYVGLTKPGWVVQPNEGDPDPNATKLQLMGAPLFGGDPAAMSIPVAFAWSTDGGANYTPATWSSGTGSSWGWWSGRLNAGGALGIDVCTWKISITPQDYQNAGRYMLDPTIVLVPEL